MTTVNINDLYKTAAERAAMLKVSENVLEELNHERPLLQKDVEAQYCGTTQLAPQ